MKWNESISTILRDAHEVATAEQSSYTCAVEQMKKKQMYLHIIRRDSPSRKFAQTKPILNRY